MDPTVGSLMSRGDERVALSEGLVDERDVVTRGGLPGLTGGPDSSWQSVRPGRSAPARDDSGDAGRGLLASLPPSPAVARPSADAADPPAGHHPARRRS